MDRCRQERLTARVRKVNEAYNGGGLLIDTCALDFGPWEEDPYKPLIRGDIEKKKPFACDVAERAEHMVRSGYSFILDDVVTESDIYTTRLFDARKELKEQNASYGVMEAADRVLHHRTRLQSTLRRYELHYADLGESYLENRIREENGSLTQNTLTDIRLVDAAYDIATKANDDVTLVSADRDIPRLATRVATSHLGQAYNVDNVNVVLLRPRTVRNMSWKDL